MSTEIETVRGAVPDDENGGELKGGMIIGPTISVTKYRFKGETRLFDTRPEIVQEQHKRDLKLDIFSALNLNLVVGQPLTVKAVSELIVKHGVDLRKVLGKAKYIKTLHANK